MGCDDYPLIIGGRYHLGDVVAVQWNPDLADQFPDADHHGCLQSMREVNGVLKPFYPALCHDYHCPRCGQACGMYGHRHCDQLIDCVCGHPIYDHTAGYQCARCECHQYQAAP